MVLEETSQVKASYKVTDTVGYVSRKLKSDKPFCMLFRKIQLKS